MVRVSCLRISYCSARNVDHLESQTFVEDNFMGMVCVKINSTKLNQIGWLTIYWME